MYSCIHIFIEFLLSFSYYSEFKISIMIEFGYFFYTVDKIINKIYDTLIFYT